MLIFAMRNGKELLRDRLNLFFGILFPLMILYLLSAIQHNIPVQMFEINNLTPGIAVFGLSFITLFSGMLIAKDRTSSFLLRLFSSPLTSADYIIGYALPLIPMAAAQSAVCFLAALPLGLKFSVNLLLAIAVLLPAALFYIAVGLLCGSLLSDKAVGGVCGALLTNVSAWLSGIWFDVSLLGDTFKKIAYALPFVNAVDATRAACAGNYAGIVKPAAIVSAYAVVLFAVAVFVFRGKMKA